MLSSITVAPEKPIPKTRCFPADVMRLPRIVVSPSALCRAEGIALGDAVCARALAFARRIVPAAVTLEVFAIDRQGNLVGEALEVR